MSNAVMKVVGPHCGRITAVIPGSSVNAGNRRPSDTRAGKGQHTRQNCTSDAVSILNLHGFSLRQVFNGGGTSAVWQLSNSGLCCTSRKTYLCDLQHYRISIFAGFEASQARCSDGCPRMVASLSAGYCPHNYPLEHPFIIERSY